MMNLDSALDKMAATRDVLIVTNKFFVYCVLNSRQSWTDCIEPYYGANLVPFHSPPSTWQKPLMLGEDSMCLSLPHCKSDSKRAVEQGQTSLPQVLGRIWNACTFVSPSPSEKEQGAFPYHSFHAHIYTIVGKI